MLVRVLLLERKDLHVVIMSATLHTDLFTDYFGGCPHVFVPGFTHPVDVFFLEDVLKMVNLDTNRLSRVAVSE
jgi:HrpA-like RNA helicase